jgi:hypothetical protein
MPGHESAALALLSLLKLALGGLASTHLSTVAGG